MSIRTVKVIVQIQQHLAAKFPKLWLERELHFRPNHFESEFWLVPVFCDKAKTAIDIGANKGIYSYYMAKFSNDVIAFEPNVDLCAELRNLLGHNLRIETVALSRESTEAVMWIDQSNTGVSTIEENNDLSCVRDKSAVISRVVETRTLDSFDISNVCLIKIDVEGHEEAVIEGASDTIARNRPVLIIESEERHNPGAPFRLAEMLCRQSYQGFYLKNRQLTSVNQLCHKDIDPQNLDVDGVDYINNFIFIPTEQSAKLQRAQALLSSR